MLQNYGLAKESLKVQGRPMDFNVIDLEMFLGSVSCSTPGLNVIVKACPQPLGEAAK